MKDVELTERSSERRANKSYFIGPSVYRYSVYKENLHYFDLTCPCLAIPDQGQLVCVSFTKAHLHTSTDS